MGGDFRVEGVVLSVESQDAEGTAWEAFIVKVEPQVARSRDGDEINFPGRTLQARRCFRMREMSIRVAVGARVSLVIGEPPSRVGTIVYRHARLSSR